MAIITGGAVSTAIVCMTTATSLILIMDSLEWPFKT